MGQLVGLRSEEFDAHRCSPPFPGYSGDSTCPTPFALCVSGTLVKTGAPEHKSLIIRFNRSHQPPHRSEEHTSELQSLMRISYAVFCLKKKKQKNNKKNTKYNEHITIRESNKHKQQK